MSIQTRLILAAVVAVGVTTYLAFAGAAASWQYYLTVDECVTGAEGYVGQPLRVHGKILAGSLQIDRNRSSAAFTLAGQQRNLQVICGGTLPDNLAEEMEVVVEGRLETTDRVRGHKLLTKCASKYTSQEKS